MKVRGPLLLVLGRTLPLLFLLLLANRSYAQTDDYKAHTLKHGIRIDVPSHWTVLESDVKKNINLTGRAIAGNSGVEEEESKKETLIAVNATPSPTGAMLRVSVTTPAPFTQADFANFGVAELAAVRDVMREQI